MVLARHILAISVWLLRLGHETRADGSFKRGPIPTPDGESELVERLDLTEGYTMMIATHDRDTLLEPLLLHLTSSPAPPSLRHIVVVWQNVERPELPPFLFPSALDELSTSGVVVTVRKSRMNSMNERFRPLLDWNESVQTDHVMIMDDDVVLRKETLEWGYQEFLKSNPLPKKGANSAEKAIYRKQGRIVGFTGRDAELTTSLNEDGKAVTGWEYIFQPRKSYSMVLSNAAWFKTDWLVQYWEENGEGRLSVMPEMRKFVDKVFNCDDLLINFLVSSMTHQPPLLLQPQKPLRTIPSEGLWNSMSKGDLQKKTTTSKRDQVQVNPSSQQAEKQKEQSGTQAQEGKEEEERPEHFTTRTVCLDHFFKTFAKLPQETVPSDSESPPPSTSLVDRIDNKGYFSSPLYPLIRTSTSSSQDVVDHARWLSPGEPWEEPVWEPLNTRFASSEDVDEDEEVGDGVFGTIRNKIFKSKIVDTITGGGFKGDEMMDETNVDDEKVNEEEGDEDDDGEDLSDMAELSKEEEEALEEQIMNMSDEEVEHLLKTMGLDGVAADSLLTDDGGSSPAKDPTHHETTMHDEL